MVKFYVKRILDGKMSIDEVPARWHDAVVEELNKQSYTA